MIINSEGKINEFIKDRDVFEFAQKVEEIGGEVFLVGGSIRDILMGKTPKEYDMEIFASEKENGLDKREFSERIESVMKDFGKIELVGKSYGVYKIKGKNWDVSFPRKETKIGETRKDYYVVTNPLMSYSLAQRRRDLTINSLLFSPTRNIIIDNYNGMADIRDKLIRCVSEETFVEDPLRAYRVAQFVSRLGFRVEEKTKIICSQMDFSKLSFERIEGEMKKLFLGEYPWQGLEFLYETEILRKNHPELNSYLEESYWNKVQSWLRCSKSRERNELEFVLAVFLSEFFCQNQDKEVLKYTGDFIKSFIIERKIRTKVSRILKLFLFFLNTLLEESLDIIAVKVAIIQNVDICQDAIGLIEIYNEVNNENLNSSLIKYAKSEIQFDMDNRYIRMVTGKDLKKELSWIPCEKYSDVLDFALRLELADKSKQEVLELIKRRFR